MATNAMAQPAVERPSSRAVNPNYRTSTDIMSRGGGIVWGGIILFLGVMWFAVTAFNIDIGPVGNLVLPFLMIVAGLYLLVTKLIR